MLAENSRRTCRHCGSRLLWKMEPCMWLELALLYDVFPICFGWNIHIMLREKCGGHTYPEAALLVPGTVAQAKWNMFIASQPWLLPQAKWTCSWHPIAAMHKANMFIFRSMQRPSPTVSVQAHDTDHGAGQASQWHGYTLPWKVSRCVQVKCWTQRLNNIPNFRNQDLS